MRKLCFVVLANLMVNSSAYSFITDYLTGYKLGIELASSQNNILMSYDTDSNQGHSNCLRETGETAYRCKQNIDAGSSSGYGLFLAQPFKSSGNFYFGADLGFGLRYLEGEFQNANRNTGLQQASFSLISFAIKPYIQFGWTPNGLPDILVTIGPVAHISAGTVEINETPKSSMVAGVSGLQGYFELEIVFLRFGSGGAFGLFLSNEVSGNNEGSELYSGEIDGMSDIKGSFASSAGGGTLGFGLRLLLDFP